MRSFFVILLYILGCSGPRCGGGAAGAAAAVRTGEGIALRSWDWSREDFLLGWYNITCLCSKATKGLGAPLRAYVGAKFLGWPIVPSSMGAYYRTGSPLLESLTLT